MTPRLLARLFVVPLLIVVMIVGSSVLVVLLFGWISTSQQEPIERLVERIEAGSGDKVLGVALLPRDKEVWQAAMELARRLDPEHPQSVTAEQRADIAERLQAILEQSRGGSQHEQGREMQQFLLGALGDLAQAGSVRLLTTYAADAAQPVPVRRAAIAALVSMRREPAAREALPELASLLDSPDPVVRVTAVVAVGAIASPTHVEAIAALTRAYRSNDREMSWNAALALARLGSRVAQPLLQDMLTRAYWESQRLDVGNPSSQGERRLTPTQVENYLLVTVDAAEALHRGAATPPAPAPPPPATHPSAASRPIAAAPDPSTDLSLRAALETLRSDSSLAVRDRARRAIEAW